MRAVAVIEPNIVEMVTDVPMPDIGEYQALVRVRACGICSSTDLKSFITSILNQISSSSSTHNFGARGCRRDCGVR